MFEKHYFLNEENFYQRLEGYYEKYGQIILAYDFDDTVYDCRHLGRDYTELMNLIRRMDKYAYLIVFTSRPKNEYQMVKDFLNENNIPFDAINEDAPQTPEERRCRKVYYHVLLDDKAGLLMAYNALQKFLKVHECPEKDLKILA